MRTRAMLRRWTVLWVLVLAAGPAPPAQAAQGELLWSSFLGAGGEASTSAVAASPDASTVYVAGTCYSCEGGEPETTDAFLAAFDAQTGARRWAVLYADGGYEYAYALAVSPGGGQVFLTGIRVEPGSLEDVLTLAFDAHDGTRLWAARYDSGGSDYGYAAAVSPDGGTLYVSGYASSPETYGDYLALAYDTASGDLRWEARYDTGREDSGYVLSLAPDGSRLYVTGQSADEDCCQRYAATTVAFDAASGERLWVARHRQGQEDYGYDVAASPDGSVVFVTGETWDEGGDNDFLTLAYDAASGEELWAATYDPGGQGGGLYVAAGASAAFVAGYGPQGIVTLRYEAASGEQAWVAREELESWGYPYAVEVTPDGSQVLVASQVPAGDGSDILTVAYQASSGAAAWRATFDDGAGWAWPAGVAFAPGGGAAYVAGSSWREGLGTDAVLLAYRLNRPPLASFSFSPGQPIAGQPVAFSDASTDPDGQVVAWSWDFGDGDGALIPAPRHVYREPGSYTVTLTVTDDQGGQATATRVLEVIAAPSAPQAFTASPGPGPVGEVSLSWQPPLPDAARPLDGYRLYRSSALEGRQLVASFGPQDSGFVDHPLPLPLPYRYELEGFNAAGSSPPAVACSRPSPWGLVLEGCGTP